MGCHDAGVVGGVIQLAPDSAQDMRPIPARRFLGWS